MKPKKILLLMVASFVFAVSSLLGTSAKTMTIANATEPVAVTAGNDINGIITAFGENVTEIKHATSDEFELAEPTTEFVDIAERTVSLWLDGTVVYYYAQEETESVSVMLPTDASYMFMGLTNVTKIDMSGFDFTLVENIEGLFFNSSKLESIDVSNLSASENNSDYIFESCSALKEITLGSDSVYLFNSAKVLWEDATIYNKTTGDVVSEQPTISAGQTLTITNVAALKTMFDFRDGKGFIESNANEFSYNPERTGLQFAGWSTTQDSVASKVDFSEGTSSTSYDEGDFVAGSNYYAVWKKNEKIVLTSVLNLTSTSDVDNISSYGYSWNATTKTLTINGLNIENNNTSENGVILPDTATVVITSNSENNIQSKANAISCSGLEIKTSESVTGALNLAGNKALVSTGNVTLLGGTINIENSIENAMEINGKFAISGGVIDVTCLSGAPITAGSIEILAGTIQVASEWSHAIYSVGNVEILGGSISLSAGVDSNCIYSHTGNIAISGGVVEAESKGESAALNANSGNVALVDFATLKVGLNKSSAAAAETYNNETYLIVKFHDVVISVNGDKIIATCQNESCELANKKIEVTVSIGNKTYNGTANKVSVSNKSEFEQVVKGNLIIKYVGTGTTVYTETTVAPSSAGTYQVTVTLSGTEYKVVKSFAIEKANVVLSGAPTAKNLEYNGTAQQLVNAGVCTNGVLKYRLENGEYLNTIPTSTNAGEYKVYYKVFGGENYFDSDESFVTVTITPKEIVIIWQENEFVYTGSIQTISAKYKNTSNEDVDLVVNIDREFRNVGTYTATVSFAANDNNYKLPSVNQKTFNIAKAKVQKPVADTTKYIYNSEEQTYIVSSSDKYQVTGNKRTDAGVYTVLVSLNDKTNYEWADSTTTDLTFEFVINRATMIGAKDKLGNDINDVEIKSAVGGIHPNAVFEIDLIKNNDTNSIKVLDSTLRDNGKLTATQKVYSGIDLKLKIGNETIQPNGKIVLNVKVPEALKSSVYEIYHIHTQVNGTKEISKLTYSQIDANGYVSIELDKFSEIVFVIDEVPVQTFPVHWLFIGIIGVFIILFLIWFFVLKRNKYDTVSKIVVSLFEVAGVVMLCLFRNTDLRWYAIINLFVFVAVDMFYMINSSKEKKSLQEKQPTQEQQPPTQEQVEI